MAVNGASLFFDWVDKDCKQFVIFCKVIGVRLRYFCRVL